MMYTYNQAVEFVIAVIERHPQGRAHVYVMPDSGITVCANVHVIDGVKTPGCLVGSVFIDLLGIDAVPQYGTARNVIVKTNTKWTPKAFAFLMRVQRAQDFGKTWGAAFDMAVDSVKDMEEMEEEE